MHVERSQKEDTMVYKRYNDYHCTNCGVYIGRRTRAVWMWNMPFCTRICQIDHEDPPVFPDVRYVEEQLDTKPQ